METSDPIRLVKGNKIDVYWRFAVKEGNNNRDLLIEQCVFENTTDPYHSGVLPNCEHRNPTSVSQWDCFGTGQGRRKSRQQQTSHQASLTSLRLITFYF